jgi:hypothetical protein
MSWRQQREAIRPLHGICPRDFQQSGTDKKNPGHGLRPPIMGARPSWTFAFYDGEVVLSVSFIGFPVAVSKDLARVIKPLIADVISSQKYQRIV